MSQTTGRDPSAPRDDANGWVLGCALLAGALVALSPWLGGALGDDLATLHGLVVGGGVAGILVAGSPMSKAPIGARAQILSALALLAVVVPAALAGPASPAGIGGPLVVGLLAGVSAVAVLLLVRAAVRARAAHLSRLRGALAVPFATPIPGSSADDYSPEAALADVAGSRRAAADHMAAPAWYYPVIAAGLALVVLALGLGLPWWAVLMAAAVSVALSAGAASAYRRRTGMWFSTVATGPAGAWFGGYVASIVLGVALALVASQTPSGSGLAWFAALVVVLGVTTCGVRYDDAARRALAGADETRDMATR